MKAWLKGGLIAVGLQIVLGIFALISGSLKNLYLFAALNYPIAIMVTSLNLGDAGFFLMLGLAVIWWFIIGAIIGWLISLIISKIKSRKQNVSQGVSK